MYKSEIIFLTGAGASMPTGVPGMAGMASKFEEYVAGRDRLTHAYKLLLDFGASRDVEELLELANDVVEFPDSKLNRLVRKTVAPQEGKKKLRDFRLRLLDNVDKITDFREELLDWITAVCLEFDRPTAEYLYSDIVGLAAQKNLPVFTTNYDAVLDHVARDLGIPIVDNFVAGQHGRQFWDETLSSFHGDGLKLVKIHGSIEWHATENGVIEKLHEPAPRNREGKELTQLLIFPTRFKDIYEQNYFPLYTAFTRTLGNASTLIIVGHSLRDEYLLAAIRERLRDRDFRVVFVGPEFPAEKKLTSPVRGPTERRVAHLNRRIQDVYPLIHQAVRDIPADSIHEHLRTAARQLSRGRKDKVDVGGLQRYVLPGETVEFDVTWETIVGGVQIVAEIAPDKDWGVSEEVDLVPLDGKEASLEIYGMQEDSCRVSLKVPDSRNAGSYGLRINLVDDSGESIARRERVLTLKSQ